MDFGFMSDDEDILMRVKNDDGIELTFVTAPATAFSDEDDLGPIVTGWGDQIYVAFNGDKIGNMISDSIDKNGEMYGEDASAFLPISFVIRKGIIAAQKYLNENPV